MKQHLLLCIPSLNLFLRSLTITVCHRHVYRQCRNVVKLTSILQINIVVSKEFDVALSASLYVNASLLNDAVQRCLTFQE